MRSDARLLLLDKDQVDRLMHPADVMNAVSEAFVLHSQREGRVFPVVRESLVTGGIFGIKAGDVQSQALLGFKAAGFWPSNRKSGGEPHQATILLIDPSTGRPLCVIDGNTITTMRTGAAGALGLKTLARADSTRICVFGTGVQATVQLRFALEHLPSLQQVQYVTHSGKRDPQFEAAFLQQCDISHSTDSNKAVAASDVVVTATPGGGALFDADAVQPGTHLKAWLMTILRNHYINGLRRSRIEVETVAEIPESILPSPPNQEHVVEVNEVASALQQMSLEHREILVLVSAAGLSYEEAAEVCGCAIGTIKSRLNRARAELKRVLAKFHGLAGEPRRDGYERETPPPPRRATGR